MPKLGFARVVLAVLIAGLAGCAALEPRTAQEIVRQRAQARWDALVASDVPKAYGYFSPASKSLTTQETYRNSIRPGFWKSVMVEKVDCPTSDSCDVIATIEYEFRGSRQKTPLKETWIREGLDWWYVHK